MATFTNAWDETIPLDDSTSGLSEAGKIDDLIRQLKLDIRERINKFMPLGMIIKWTSDIIPYGFKDCKGTSLSRTTYAGLFSVIGTTYGSVDSASFNIPDCRGRFIRGWNHSKASGLYDPDAASRTDRGDGTAGDHVGTKQEDENAEHLHEYYTILTVGGTIGVKYFALKDIDPEDTDETGEENRPDNIYFKYIIRCDDQDSDGSYSYTREWDEAVPVGSDYMGRMALEVRKLKRDVQELLDNMFPVGMVIYWPGDSCPEGYLELNGQEVSKITYSYLYDLWEDYFGVAASEENFKLPDCRGIFIRAQDDGASVDAYVSTRTGGGIIGSTQDNNVKKHAHTINTKNRTDFGLGVGNQTNFPITNMIYRTDSTTTDSPARTVETHPKNINLMAIVKCAGCI